MAGYLKSQFNREDNLETFDELYAKVLGKDCLDDIRKSMKKNGITDLPVLVTPDGAVACIPKHAEMGVIATVGMTGYAKTLTAGLIIDEIFWNWGDYVAIINDPQEETLTWSEPQDVSDFSAKLKYVDQNPMPLPMIYLFPNSEKYRGNEELVKDKNNVLISVPFEEIINNIEKYIKLDNSEKYLVEKKEELLKITSEEELWDIIDSIDTGTKGMDAVVRKIKASLRMFIDEGILNISSSIAPSTLITMHGDRKIYEGNPFTAIMHAQCIPSFITGSLSAQPHKDAIFSYYIDLLFEENKSGSMKGKRVWLYFEELTSLIHSDPEKSNKYSERALSNLAARCRNNTLSLIYTTQNYNEIPYSLRSQTKTAIIFRHKSKELARLICDDFALDNDTRKEILRLKMHEAILTTTSGKFVCYKGKERWEQEGPIKGIVIPPLHKNLFRGKK